MNWRPKTFQWLAAAVVVLTSLAATAAVKPNPYQLFICGGSSPSPQTATAITAAKPNPYGKIPDRNVFHLVPIPDGPLVCPPPQPRQPPPKVFITGLVELGGVSVALVEINEPGKPVRRAILSAGESAGELEVLAVDVAGERVHVRIDGDEETLSIEKPKPPKVAPPQPPLPLPQRPRTLLRG